MENDKWVRWVIGAIAGLSVVIFSIILCIVSIDPGEIGVVVKRTGGNQGVQSEVLNPGLHLVSPTTKVYEYVTHKIIYRWTQQVDEYSQNDESIEFNAAGGAIADTDVGITFYIPPKNAPKVFAEYRMPMDQLRSSLLFTEVKKAVNEHAPRFSVDDLYSNKGRNDLHTLVEQSVKSRLAEHGILVESVDFIGLFRFSKEIQKMIVDTMTAKQEVSKVENELKVALAQVNKKVAVAEGDLKVAELDAQKMQVLAEQASPAYIKLQLVNKWDGKMPIVVGSSSMILPSELFKQ